MLSWLLFSTIAAAEIQVLVRAGDAGAVACVVRDAQGAAAAGRLARTPAGDWRWRRLEGDVLTCSSPGFEPMDVDAGPAGLPRRIQRELWPARMVTLQTEGSGTAAVIEWRAIGEGVSSLIARQRVHLDGRLELPVARIDRVLRVCPSGRSPMSLFVPAGASNVTLRVPPLRPGGEVFGRLPAHAFVPVAVELTADGAAQVLAPDARRFFQASGIAPGTYALVPAFRGGLRGRAEKVVIHAGETAERLPLSLPEPGAVSLVAVPQICTAQYFPARLVLRGVNAEGGLDPLPVADLPAPPCARDLEGLAGGTYEASLRTAGGREAVGLTRVTVQPGQRTQARLVAAEVRVGGRLTMGADHPAPGFTLLFENDGETWTAQSDENGEYRTALGAAGEYRVSIPALADVVEATFTRRFHAGEQTADFALGAGAIHVRVARDDSAPLEEPVQVALTAQTGRRLTGGWSPQEGGEKRFLGLEPGPYWVTGSTASGLVSQGAPPVELTPEQPLAEVDLVLGRHEGILEVVDEAGAPVSPSQVEGRETLLATSGSPGAFLLREVPVGEWLKVRAPGFLTACRILQPDDLPAMRVVLRPTQESVTLYLDPHLPWDAGRLVAPGSNCPLAMSDLEYEAQPERTRTTVKLRLARGRYELAVGGVMRALDAPGGEIDFSSPVRR